MIAVRFQDGIGHIAYVVRCSLNDDVEGQWLPDFSEMPAQDDLEQIETLARIEPEEWYSITGQELTDTISQDNIETQRELFLQMYPYYRT